MRGQKRSREEWARLVAEWRGSGLTQKGFARRKGIAAATLSWWSCRLRRERRGTALVPVQVIGGAAGGEDFRLDLGGGRTLHVPASFDEGALRRMLAVLEGGTC